MQSAIRQFVPAGTQLNRTYQGGKAVIQGETQNKSGRTVYLPEEMTFYKLSGNKVVHKEKLKKGVHFVNVALNEVPLFVRKGKKIPLCNTGKNVDNLDTTIVEYLEG